MTDYLQRRPRRLRRTPAIRALAGEVRLHVDDLIYPLFVAEAPEAAGPIASMPGVSRFTVDQLAAEVEEIVGLGIRGVLLFGVPRMKDSDGSSAWAADGVVPQAVARIRAATDRLCVMTDVCLCSYTDHGHCGPIRDDVVDNDATLYALQRIARSHADAGVDFVAPSGMMDGMVGAIRTALDESTNHDVGIMSYAVKYASSFYGPFRDAADSKPTFGDRRSYQMDPHNAREALAETRLDVAQGADIVMVKPALPYLDIVRRLRDERIDVPLAAYQVSGEYGMLKAAAANGWIDAEPAMMESLVSIRRAGADMIITYFAKDAARVLRR